MSKKVIKTVILLFCAEKGETRSDLLAALDRVTGLDRNGNGSRRV